jgi:hypothetical protein
MPTSTVTYLYGHDCLGESRDDEWLYYLNDGIGYVRQGADAQGQAVSSWLFDPDGAVLEGPQGPVSHLICGGVYDWSTGLIHRNGRYFDPMLGIWLALAPLVVVQSWRGRKRKRGGMPWYVLVLVVVGVGSGVLTACGNGNDGTKTPTKCVSEGTSGPPGRTSIDEIDDLITAHLYDEAIQEAIVVYSLPVPVGLQNGVNSVYYDSSVPGAITDGLPNEITVRLGDEIFEGYPYGKDRPGWLASTIGHEFVHVKQRQANNLPPSRQKEDEAYLWELNHAHWLTPEQRARVVELRATWGLGPTPTP